MPLHVDYAKEGCIVTVRVMPSAKKNECAEIMANGVLKVRLTAPPVDNKANEALTSFFSDFLEISRSNLSIISGQTSRTKRLLIKDYTDDIIQRLSSI